MKTPQRNNTRPGRKRSKLINYHESPLSKELNDSDYEPTAKKEKPLDNKRFPSSIRIVIQKNIEINRMIANQGNDSELDGAVGSTITKSGRQDNNVEPTLLDATDNSKSSNEMPVATSSPRPKETWSESASKLPRPLVPDEKLVDNTESRIDDKRGTVQPDETIAPSNVASGNTNTANPVASNSEEYAENAKEASDNKQNIKNSDAQLPLDNNNNLRNDSTENDKIPDDASTNTQDVKPTRGEFQTRIVGIWRQKDPRAFKCSCCSKYTMTLYELNAHFISTHWQVKCDMCNQYFNTPSSLKKYKYMHSDEKYACRSCDREFPFESQLHSHHHSLRR